MPVALVVALGLVVGLLTVLVIGLLRSHAEILRALHDLGVHLEDGAEGATAGALGATRGPGATAAGVPRPRAEASVGDVAHDISGDLPEGGSAQVAVVDVPHATVLAFLSSGCGTCAGFWEALADDDLRRLPGGDARVVIVTQGHEHESAATVADLAPVDVVTVMSSEAWDSYRVPVSPYFVLVDGPSGRVVGEGAGTTWEQVVDLLGRSVADQDIVAAQRRRSRRGGERAAEVDRALLAAGIGPDDPSLYPPELDQEVPR